MNWLYVERNKNYVFTAYTFRRGFQKFNRRGRLLYSTVSEEDKEIDYTKNVDVTPSLFSTAIALDKNNVLWLATTQKSATGNEHLLELYNAADGSLMSAIPLDHPVNKIRIFKDQVFLIDTHNTMSVYEYKLLDVE